MKHTHTRILLPASSGMSVLPFCQSGQFQGLTSGFHTSSLLPYFWFGCFFWWYMEFHRTSFIEGSIFFPEPFKNAVLFGCLSIFYFLIVSVTGTSNWEQLLIFTCFLGKDAVIYINLLQKHPNPFFLNKGEYIPAIIYLRSAWTKVCHAHKHMWDALSWCFKKLSQRLWCFYSTHFYNLKITTCSYSGTRILENEESAHFPLFCYFANEFLKIFKTMLMSF